MRYALLVALVVVLAAVPWVPPASAGRYTVRFAGDGYFGGSSNTNMVAIGAGCASPAPKYACVDDVPPGPHDGNTTYLRTDGTATEFQADFTANWTLPPEDDVYGVSVHLVARTSALFPAGSSMNLLVQENVGVGRLCVYESLIPIPGTAVYRDWAYPSSLYDTTCADSDVHTWEMLVVVHCGGGCVGSPVWRLTAWYVELLVTDRLGFFASGDSLMWLLYIALVVGGLLLTAWIVYSWRRRRGGR